MAFEGSKTLAEQIARHLADRIIRFELPSGERILESKLADELGVSRSPIREAFRMLEKSRLLEVSPHRGARVSELSESTIKWVFDVLTELAALLARRAAESPGDKDIQMLRDVQKKMEDCAKKADNAGYYDCFFEGARVVRGMVENPLLEDVISDFEPTVGRILYGSLAHQRDDLNKNLKFLQRIIRHIIDCNPDKAAEAVRDYANSERDHALKMHGKRFEPSQKFD